MAKITDILVKYEQDTPPDDETNMVAGQEIVEIEDDALSKEIPEAKKEKKSSPKKKSPSKSKTASSTKPSTKKQINQSISTRKTTNKNKKPND